MAMRSHSHHYSIEWLPDDLVHRIRTKAQILAKLFDGYHLMRLLLEVLLDLFNQVSAIAFTFACY